MDSDHEENLYCPGCAESFKSGTTFCVLCELQLNEEPDIIEIGLVERLESQKKRVNDQLLIGAKAALGTCDFQLFENRTNILHLNFLKEKCEPHGLSQLHELFEKIVDNPGKKFTLLDDNSDQITLATISNQDGNIYARFSNIPWEELFDENRERRLCQLLAGFKSPTQGWFDKSIAEKIDANTQLIHSSMYRDARHSQTLDNFIKNSFPNLHIEKRIYTSDGIFTDLITNLCLTAPMDNNITALSAKIDNDGNVTYEDVIIFPKNQFIKPEKTTTISVKSNTVNRKTSKLIFSKETDGSKKNYYEYDLDVEPGKTKQFSIKIERRQIDSITVDDNKVKAFSGKLERPVIVDVSRRCIEVFLVLDTIVFNEKAFKSRKQIVEDLISEFGKYKKQIDIIFHLYSYSCDFVPAYSRPLSWPSTLFTEFSGSLYETIRVLQTLKMSGPGPHVFPGRLELVFEKISEYNFDSKKIYYLFIVGNRPASPEKDLPKMYGVSISWKKEWEAIKSKFSLIQVIHDDNFVWAKESFTEFFRDYYDSFWNTIQRDSRIPEWSKVNLDKLLNENLSAIANPNNELTIPSVNQVKGW